MTKAEERRMLLQQQAQPQSSLSKAEQRRLELQQQPVVQPVQQPVVQKPTQQQVVKPVQQQPVQPKVDEKEAMKALLENYAKENKKLPSDAKELKAIAEANGLYSGENKYQIDKLQATQTSSPVVQKKIATSSKGELKIDAGKAYDKSYGKQEAINEAKNLDFSKGTNADKYAEYKEKLQEAKQDNDTRNITKYSNLVNIYKNEYKNNDFEQPNANIPALKNILSQDAKDLNELTKAYYSEQDLTKKQDLARQIDNLQQKYQGHLAQYNEATAYDEIMNNNILKDSATSLGYNALGGTANIINAGYSGLSRISGFDAATINPNTLYDLVHNDNATKDVGNRVTLARLQAIQRANPDNQRLRNLTLQIENKNYQGTVEDIKNELNEIQKELYQSFKDRFTQDDLDRQAQQAQHNQIYGMASFIPNAFGTVGNMIPSIALAPTSAGASMGALGAGAYSSSMDQALQNGATYNQAVNYGLLSGATEVGTELLGGETVNKLLGQEGKTVLGKVFGTAIDKLNIESKVGRIIANTVSDVAGEMTEEMIAEAVNPLFKYITYDKNAFNDYGSVGNYLKGVLQAGVDAIPSTLIMQGMGVGSNAIKVNQIENGLIKSINESDLSQIVKNQLVNEVRKASTDVKLGLEESTYMQDKAYEKGFNLAAQSEQMKQRIPQGYSLPQSTLDILSFVENNRPGLTITFNANAQGNGTFIENPDGTRTITLNPNSQRAVEFTLTHELGHDLKGTQEYKQLQDLLVNYAEGKEGYKKALKSLDKTYNESNANYNLTDEATNDMLGQAIGEQEFYNKLAENPTLFNKVTSELQNLLGNKETKLKNKIEKLTKNAYQSVYKGTGSNQVQNSLSETKEFKKDLENKFEQLTGDSILVAETKLAGIELRNNWRKNGNLDGEFETTPYSQEAMELYKKYQNSKKTSSYLYHATGKDRLESIIKNGLTTGNKQNQEGVSAAKELYLAATPELAESFSTSDSVTLRINPRFYDKFENFKEDLLGGEGSYSITNNIPPEMLQIKENNKWIPLLKSNQAKQIQSNTQYSLSEAPTQDNQGRQLSEGQQEYFKDSKVRDENGNLLELYHGSKSKGFNIFNYDPNRQTGTDFGKAFYFTTDFQKAQGYSYSAHNDPRLAEYDKGKDAAWQKYQQTKNPDDFQAYLNYTYNGMRALDLINDEDYVTDNGEVKKVYLKLDNPLIVDAKGKYYYEVYDDYFKQARENSNDGIIVKNVIDNPRGKHRPIDVYIAFNENQIKNVDNLNPTSNPDIRYSKQNGQWQQFLDKNFNWRPNATKTNFLPSNEELTQNVTKSVENEPILGESLEKNAKNEPKVQLVQSDDDTLFSLSEKEQQEVNEWANEFEKDKTIDPEFAEKVWQEFNKIKDYVDFQEIKNEVKQYKDKMYGMQTEPEVVKPKPIEKNKYSAEINERIKKVEDFIADYKTAEGTRGRTLKSKDVTEAIQRNVGKEPGNTKTIRNTIKSMNEDMQAGRLTDNKIDEYVQSLGDNLKATISDYYDTYKKLKDHIRGAKIYVPDEVKRGITDYNDFRKSNMGLLKLTSDSSNLGIDKVYAELQEMYPDMLPDDIINPIDQLEYLSELGKSITKEEGSLRKIVEKQYGDNAWDEVAKGLKNDLIQLRDSEQTEEIEPEEKEPNEKNRRWTNTTRANELVNQFLDVKDLTYVPASNRKQINYAQAQINKLGYEDAVKYIDNKINLNERFSANDIAMGELLIQESIKRGQFEKAQDLISDVAIIGTDLGQAVQALSLIARMTPEGQLKHLNKVINKINENIEKGNIKKSDTKKLETIKLDTELATNILKATNELELQQAMDAALQKIADQMPVTFSDKVAEWRYLAMLANPRTHIRNVLANVAMKGTSKIKNTIQRGIETIASPFLDEKYRTFEKATEDVKKFAEQSMKDNANRLSGNKEKGIESRLKELRKVFKNEKLERLRRLNSDWLSIEDNKFTNSAYKSNLAEYLTANGIKTQHDIDMNPEIVQKGIKYATEEAWKTTFHQASNLASTLSRLEQSNEFAKLFVGGTVPFKKTPINIAKTGASYSPLGLLETVTNQTRKLRNGDITANQYIDRLSQGLTGSALFGVGALLAHLGILKGGTDDEDYEESIGKTKEYSIRLDKLPIIGKILGKKNYDISWLAPSGIPLLMGAELVNAAEKGEGNLTALLESLEKSMNPLTEMSVLQGIESTLSSYSNKNLGGKIGAVFENAAKSYLGQFLPTIGGQFNKIVDTTQRTTAASKDSKWRAGESFARQQLNKIPFASYLLEPKTDVWGNEVKRDSNPAIRAFEALINPGSITKDNTTNVDEEILSLFSETGNKDVVPKVPANYFTYQGETYKTNAKDYTTYKKTTGQYMYSIYSDLIENEYYKQLEPDKKATIIKKIADDAKDVGKASIGVETNNYFKLDTAKDELEKADIPLVDYYLLYAPSTGSAKKTGFAQTVENINNVQGKDYITKDKKNALKDIFGIKN